MRRSLLEDSPERAESTIAVRVRSRPVRVWDPPLSHRLGGRLRRREPPSMPKRSGPIGGMATPWPGCIALASSPRSIFRCPRMKACVPQVRFGRAWLRTRSVPDLPRDVPGAVLLSRKELLPVMRKEKAAPVGGVAAEASPARVGRSSNWPGPDALRSYGCCRTHSPNRRSLKRT